MGATSPPPANFYQPPSPVHLDLSEHNEHRALHFAVLHRNPDMVRLLMDHGADPHKGIWPHRDAIGALTLAADRGYDEIVAIIKESLERRRREAEPDETRHSQAFDRSSPFAAKLFAAFERGDESAIIALLAQHPEAVHWHSGDGWTALHQASLMSYVEVARWLIGHGANVNAYAPCCWTPSRARRRLPEELRAGNHGPPGGTAEVARRGHDRRRRHRARRHCAIHDRLEIAALLLERGADPNPSIYAATSSMFEARQRGHGDMIALLERHGGFADVYVIGHFGLVDEARSMLADEAAGRLREGSGVEAGGSVAASLLQSGTDGGRPGIVRLALAAIDWPAGDARWHWYLMRVLGTHAEEERERYVECFRLMLERSGADAPGAYGRTMLHDVCANWPRDVATAEERMALATMLLDAGARMDVKDDLLASTPLGWACRWGRGELVELFLARGAEAEESGTETWARPREWAVRMGHHDVVERIDAEVSSG